MKKLLALIILVVVLTACGSSEPCAWQSQKYLVEGDLIIGRVEIIAENVSIFNAEQAKDRMNRIGEETRDIDFPRCAKDAQDAIVDFIEIHADAVDSFIAGDTSEYFNLLGEASRYEDIYNEAKTEIRRGAR